MIFACKQNYYKVYISHYSVECPVSACLLRRLEVLPAVSPEFESSKEMLRTGISLVVFPPPTSGALNEGESSIPPDGEPKRFHRLSLRE